MAYTRGNHCVYDIHYHFVFSVKYRKALLRAEIEMALVAISYEIAARYEIVIECIGADKDHVHLLCSAHPKYSPGEIVRKYKRISARELFRLYPGLKSELWGGEFWGDGYFVSTVGQRGKWEHLVKYIKSQGQKPGDVNLRLFPMQSDFEA